MARDMQGREHLVWQGDMTRAAQPDGNCGPRTVVNTRRLRAELARGRYGATAASVTGHGAQSATGWKLVAALGGGHRTVRARTWRAPIPGHGVGVARLALVAHGVGINGKTTRVGASKGSAGRC
jgi:hypothetical protein